MKKRPSSSASMSTELQIWTPEKKREPSRRLDLAIVPESRGSSFTLPRDWFVDEKRRTTGIYRGTTDKYYHEPGTGRKFRSLVSVQRYLTETGCHKTMMKGDIKLEMPQSYVSPLSIAFPGVDYSSKSYLKPSSLKPRTVMKALSFKTANQIEVYRKPYIPKHQVNIDRSKPLKLPDGWYIKRVTRRSGHSMGKVDKYYCERATGRVFRSLIDVQRYLADNYIEENTTLSELFKPAGLIQMSRSEEKDVAENSDMAVVLHSINKDSYSGISDNVRLKDIVRKNDDVPLRDLVQNADDVALKDFVWKSADVPLKDFVQESDDVALKDLIREADDAPLMDLGGKLRDVVQKCDDVLLKDLVQKSSVARKTRKLSNVVASPKSIFICAANTWSVDASNHPMKIRWVLTGPGGDAWSPFSGDTMVPKSLKQEWAQKFIDIVNQKHQDASTSEALD